MLRTPPYQANSSQLSSSELQYIPEEKEVHHNTTTSSPSSRSFSTPRSSKDKDHKVDDSIRDKYYNFDDAIIQRDEAAADRGLGAGAALWAAQDRLELVLRRHQHLLGKDHPQVFLIQREVVTTCLASGVWQGKPIEQWGKEDLLKIDADMRMACEGLEETLGFLDEETLEALAVLLSLRISLVEIKALPWTGMTRILDLLKERLGHPEVQTPGRLLHTLRIRYKIAASLAQIWHHGDTLIHELLKETDGLVATVDEKYLEDLSRLRFEIKVKISELEEWRNFI